MNAVLRLVALSALMAPVVGCVDRPARNPAASAPVGLSGETESSPITPASPQQPDSLPFVLP